MRRRIPFENDPKRLFRYIRPSPPYIIILSSVVSTIILPMRRRRRRRSSVFLLLFRIISYAYIWYYIGTQNIYCNSIFNITLYTVVYIINYYHTHQYVILLSDIIMILILLHIIFGRKNFIGYVFWDLSSIIFVSRGGVSEPEQKPVPPSLINRVTWQLINFE